MKLDERGYIAIAELVLYIPILLLSIVLVVRHGAARKAGWIFFAILSIGEPCNSLLLTSSMRLIVGHLARIVGGITHIIWEQNPNNTTLQTTFSILESAGLSPLLMATLGFLSTVYVYRHL